MVNCAITCQRRILLAHGIDIPEMVLIKIAAINGWFEYGKGMYMCNNGKLLGCFNIKYRHAQHCTITDLKDSLNKGCSVMVNVNRKKLAGGNTPYAEASHAVLVIACNHSEATIFDPASNVNKSYPIENFMKAWADSSNYMLSA